MRQCLLSAVLVAAGAVGHAHTLFLIPQGAPGAPERVRLVNGTFWKSENVVEARRMTDLRLIGPEGRTTVLDRDRWQPRGAENVLVLQPLQPGSYVMGVATRPWLVRMPAEEFNDYLRHEGLEDDLAARRSRGEEDVAAAERYAKFAKAIVQVGDVVTDAHAARLGHPVEIVPLMHPARLRPGERFRARLLHEGRPLAGMLAFASSERHGAPTPQGLPGDLVTTRSDDAGVIEFEISEPGRWYVRFIHLTRVADAEHWYSPLLVWLGQEQPRIAYESSWATLTFEVSP